MSTPKPPPDKTEISQLPPYDGLALERIFVVSNERQAAQALDELFAAEAVGFDTESRPTFRKGQ